MRTDNLNDPEFTKLVRRIEKLERSGALNSASISYGMLRIIGGRLKGMAGAVLEWIGAANFTGPFSNKGPFTNEGTFTNTGPFNNSGKFTNNGELEQNGNARINGDLDIAGTTDITGRTTLSADLIVDGDGRITLGSLTLSPGGPYGGQISTSGPILHLDAETVVARNYITADNLSVTATATVLGNLTVFGAKSFGMEHPEKPGVMLRHSATESPVSGIEYWGDTVIGDDGTVEVQLPDYFDAIAKPDGRTVFVTGRGHCPDWTDIDEDHFTVTGEPGRRISWLVKAERIGGDFDIESPMPERPEAPSPQEPTDEETP